MSPRKPVETVRGIVLGLLILGTCAGQVALVRHAPALNGKVEGSIQQMAAENTTLNGGASITGSLFVPGSPTIRLNGHPSYDGTLDGAGSAAASDYTVTLNGSASLGHIVRRTDPVSLPAVGVPPKPAGTRSVSLSRPGESPGDFATLSNLSVSGGAGVASVPPGTYGSFTADSGSGFRLGLAGGTTPTTYDFQRLTLNGTSTLEVVGPVVVTVNGGVSFSTTVGAAAHPDWLNLRVAGGGVSIAGNKSVYAHFVAPDGTVTLNGGSQLVGAVASDRLIINGNSVLRLAGPPTDNRPPTVALTAPLGGSSFSAPAAFLLAATATDPDGSVARVEFYSGTSKLGEDLTPPYESAVTNLAPGVYDYTARAIDNLGAGTDSASSTVTVTSPNQPPAVSLVSPVDGSLFTAPATLALSATASDPDGSIQRVEFYQDARKLGEDFAIPFEFATARLDPGTYQFSARAYDNLNSIGISRSATVTVVAPNQSPAVAITTPANGASFQAPASFTLTAVATDPDGIITRVEFFSGIARLGEDLAAPYEYPVGGLGAGTYHFVARATDNAGSATDSVSITVTVASANRSPTIVLTAPTDGFIDTEPGPVSLAASASDPDGTIAKVEFFANTTTLGEDLSFPYQLTWPGVAAGSYALIARATDNLGAIADSAPVSITIQPAPAALPFIAEFEAAEGYRPGALHGQRGWLASTGVTVVAVATPTSQQELTVSASQPPAHFLHDISAAGATPVFVDFFARPVAGANPDESVVFETSAARFALVGAAPSARVLVFDGLAANWRPTEAVLSVGPDGRTVGWVRFTTREDYSTKQWDLYVNGRMIVADVPFSSGSSLKLSSFSATGHGTAGMSFDDLYAGLFNPIAGDADRDGMDDAWEAAHGLSSSLNDRSGDLDGDGLSNVQEYIFGSSPDSADTDGDGLTDARELVLGTKPASADSDGDGLPDGWEVSHHLNPLSPADGPVDTDGDGLSNYLEFQLGRNPIAGAVPDTNGSINLRVYSPGR